MIRGTTPTHTFTFKNPDMTTDGISSLNLVYVQKGKTILTKTLKDCTLFPNGFSVKLTQEETLAFDEDEVVEIQATLLDFSGEVAKSDFVLTTAERCLYDEVIK